MILRAPSGRLREAIRRVSASRPVDSDERERFAESLTIRYLHFITAHH
jgi:hypothetical protein